MPFAFEKIILMSRWHHPHILLQSEDRGLHSQGKWASYSKEREKKRRTLITGSATGGCVGVLWATIALQHVCVTRSIFLSLTLHSARPLTSTPTLSPHLIRLYPLTSSHEVAQEWAICTSHSSSNISRLPFSCIPFSHFFLRSSPLVL